MKLSNSELNKLKLRIENGAQVIISLLSNVIGDANDDTNFPH